MLTRRHSRPANTVTISIQRSHRIRERFAPLVLKCKDRGVAMRVGTNHGSLSGPDHDRFGDTPLGMVESALEFVRFLSRPQLSRSRVFNEGLQSQGHDSGLQIARRQT